MSENISSTIIHSEIFLGACTVRLEMPLDMQSALIFHYNLKFYNNDTDNYDGVSLKRFVMQVGCKIIFTICEIFFIMPDH